jgi:hypothetical protein
VVSTDDVDSVSKMVGEEAGDASGASFTNHYELIAPAGVVMDNLPSLLLILLALAALTAYVVSRSRRRSHEAR